VQKKRDHTDRQTIKPSVGGSPVVQRTQYTTLRTGRQEKRFIR